MPTKFEKFKKYKRKKNSWITSGIIKSIQFRNTMYRDLKLLSADEQRYNILKQNLRSYNYILRKNIKQAKRLHYHKCFHTFKTGMKKTWSLINKVLNKTETEDSFPHYFIIDGQAFNDKKAIANMFNNFFTNIGIKLANDITVSPDHNFKDYLLNKPGVSFSFKSVSELEINNIINKLDTKKVPVLMVYQMFFLNQLKSVC